MTRFSDGRRGVTQICEVLDLNDQGHYQVQEMFRYDIDDQGDAALVWTGRTSAFRQEPKVRVLRGELDLARPIFGEEARR